MFLPFFFEYFVPVNMMNNNIQNTIVLTVDDNAGMRQMVKRMLATLSARFHECSDGSEALEAYTLHRPDWVIMDVVMQQMDGITATRLLKQVYPDAKVIILTQHNDPQLREAAMQAGACEFVPKDRLDSLQRIISNSH